MVLPKVTVYDPLGDHHIVTQKTRRGKKLALVKNKKTAPLVKNLATKPEQNACPKLSGHSGASGGSSAFDPTLPEPAGYNQDGMPTGPRQHQVSNQFIFESKPCRILMNVLDAE